MAMASGRNMVCDRMRKKGRAYLVVSGFHYLKVLQISTSNFRVRATYTSGGKEKRKEIDKKK